MEHWTCRPHSLHLHVGKSPTNPKRTLASTMGFCSQDFATVAPDPLGAMATGSTPEVGASKRESLVLMAQIFLHPRILTQVPSYMSPIQNSERQRGIPPLLFCSFLGLCTALRWHLHQDRMNSGFQILASMSISQVGINSEPSTLGPGRLARFNPLKCPVTQQGRTPTQPFPFRPKPDNGPHDLGIEASLFQPPSHLFCYFPAANSNLSAGRLRPSD